MTMNEVLVLALAGVAGFALGAVFFGGLWWTVQKAVSSRRPALLFLGSLLLRMSITLAGFYAVGHADWQRLLACLFGFVVVRLHRCALDSPTGQAGKPPRTGDEPCALVPTKSFSGSTGFSSSMARSCSPGG
jgi:F1F0 ATPase subunit 2